MKSTAIAAATAVVLGVALAPQASAIERFDLSNATGLCQGALPNFEGQLRKRPAAVSNEGTRNAFISCSTTQNFFSEYPPAQQLGMIMTNNTAADVTVDCTMVEGFNYVGFLAPILHPKSFVIPAGQTLEDGWFYNDDNGGTLYIGSLNVSCNLPVGVEMGSIYLYIPEDGTAPFEPAPPA